MDKKARELVEKEVKAPATELIHALSGQYSDEIAEFSIRPDYEATVSCNGYGVYGDSFNGFHWEHKERAGQGEVSCDFETPKEAMKDCVESNNLDCDYVEALEFWIVSDWLADQLEAKGEMIAQDFLGLTIWGRATSGQAIYCDEVIREIAENMHVID
jgi:hypothetical protein